MVDPYQSAQPCGCDFGVYHLCEVHKQPHRPTTSGWIGVDFDGTLVIYPHSFPAIGPPIPPMVERVRGWLAEGKDVRIFTARVAVVPGLRNHENEFADEDFAFEQRARIEAWCGITFGCTLPVTALKDFRMVELWDDRCVQLITNTGKSLDEHYTEALDTVNANLEAALTKLGVALA